MRISVLLASLWTLLLVALCWIPQWLMPTSEEGEGSAWGIPHLDKVVHVGVFAVFAFLWLWALRGRRKYLAVAVAGIVLAVVTEAGQNHPWVGRDGSAEDGLTDLAGLIVGLPAFAAAERALRSRPSPGDEAAVAAEAASIPPGILTRPAPAPAPATGPRTETTAMPATLDPLRALAPLALALAAAVLPGAAARAGEPGPLSVSWKDEKLAIRGPGLRGGEVEVWYIEAFCRPGSTDRDWKETVIPHRTELVEAAPDGRSLRLRSRLADGVEVDHRIRAGRDEVDFEVVARNPTGAESEAHWAQPCIRVDRFTGTPRERDSEAYLPSCFVFLDGKPQRMPLKTWARRARYVPGQVWCPAHVSRDDVNPRPLSPLVPSSGLIGCYSSDGGQILATAWEPYQELFQGIIVCLHSDFRIGGLKPGESKRIRGKLYLTADGLDALVARYRKDFPEHGRAPGR